MNDLYFEDFHVGQSFTSHSLEITRERIVAFAEEFDPQPQHISETAAAASSFGALIASGWHTAAFSMRLQYEAAFGRIAGGGAGATVDNLTWLRPVKPGDVLHVVMEVKELLPFNSRPDCGVLRFLTTTLDQHGRPVETVLGTVRVPRRGPPSASLP